MRYLSVCSGIESASVAWSALAWSAVAFAEIEPFPCAVLAHHYPQITNLGDVNNFKDWPDAAFDVLVGGTPCQSFSVAGLRDGLADPRGNLALVYLGIADRYRPKWLVWENVPGALSTNDGRDFSAIVGGMVGLGYGVAWRVLDAQHCRSRDFPRAVPQRRRRIVLVGYLGDWRRAAQILFDAESLRGNPAPRRETRKRTSIPVEDCPDGSCGVIGCNRPIRKRGWCNTHYQRWRKNGDAGTTPVNEPGKSDPQRFWKNVDRTGGCWNWTAALNEKGYGIFFCNQVQGTVRAHRWSYEEAKGLIPDGLQLDHLCKNKRCVNPDHLEPVTSGENTRRYFAGDVAPTIASRTTAGGGLGTDFDCDGGLISGYGDIPDIVSQAASSKWFKGSSGPAGDEVINLIPVAFQSRYARNDRGAPSEIAYPLTAEAGRTGKGDSAQLVMAVSDPICANEQKTYTHEGEHNFRLRNVVPSGLKVRRLTPRECERLQGFPSDYTLVPFRGEMAKDGPRYRAIGNAMATNMMQWIGERIAMVERL